jgi:hypothetical protein
MREVARGHSALRTHDRSAARPSLAGRLVGAIRLSCPACTASGTASTHPSIRLSGGHHLLSTDALAGIVDTQVRIAVNSLVNGSVARREHSPANESITENSPVLAYLSCQGLLAVLVPEASGLQPIVTSVQRRYREAKTLDWPDGVGSNGQAPDGSGDENLVLELNGAAVASEAIDRYCRHRTKAWKSAAEVRSMLASLAARDPGYVIDGSKGAVLAPLFHYRVTNRSISWLIGPECSRTPPRGATRMNCPSRELA